MSSQTERRRDFIGGSDARIIMGNDEAALIRLWREKRGEIEPEDLSGNLLVQLGLATEDLNRRWYEANTGQVITDVQPKIRHPVPRLEAVRVVDMASSSVAPIQQLSATDAQQMEEGFAAKLAVIQAQIAKSDEVLSEQNLAEQTSAATQINKSVLVVHEPRRVRDRDHIRHVIKQPCLVCGRRPSDPHHLRFAQSRALNRKVSDEFTVPLCRGHHRELHRHGDEAGWWQKLGLDPTGAARALWLTTHPLSKPTDEEIRGDEGRA